MNLMIPDRRVATVARRPWAWVYRGLALRRALLGALVWVGAGAALIAAAVLL